jgi:hypothetical protein
VEKVERSIGHKWQEASKLAPSDLTCWYPCPVEFLPLRWGAPAGLLLMSRKTEGLPLLELLPYYGLLYEKAAQQGKREVPAAAHEEAEPLNVRVQEEVTPVNKLSGLWRRSSTAAEDPVKPCLDS